MPSRKTVVPGEVEEYITRCPVEVQPRLRELRDAIQQAAPDAMETVSYFDMPGYRYEGHDYNGMFAWFSYKKPFVRLHVRPPVLEEHEAELGNYARTKAILSFRVNETVPKTLIKKLVKASVKVMKGVAAKRGS